MINKKMICIIITIIVLVIGLIVFINLYNSDRNRCGNNAVFKYDNKTHTVTITGTGIVDLTKEPHYLYENMIDRGFGGMHDYDKVGELLFPAETEKIIICEGVTGIRSKSGTVCTSIVKGGTYEKLKEIVLPNTINELDIGCFANQTNLEKINIPNSIKKIPDYAFYNCEKLDGIVLPEGVKIIGNQAFENCNKLYSINFPKSLRIIEEYAFSECATLQEVKLQNIRYIGRNAFEKCYNLKNVEIYGDIAELYSYTFDVCLNLRNVKLSDTIKSMANDTFRNCKALQTKSLFENREKIYQYKWRGHENLKEMQELEKQVLNEK